MYSQKYTYYTIDSNGNKDTVPFISKAYIIVLGNYNCIGCVKNLIKLFNDSFHGLKDSVQYAFAFEKLKNTFEKRIYAFNLAYQYQIDDYVYVNDSITVKFPYFIILKKRQFLKINYETIFTEMSIKEEFIKLIKKNI